MEKIKFLFVFLGLFLLGGCVSSYDISDVKKSEMVNLEVKLDGVSKGSIKLGDFSGYLLEDETGEIFISTSNLEDDGEDVRVKGIVRKNLLGYYIEVEE